MSTSFFRFPDDANIRQFTAPHCPKCEVASAHQRKLGINFEIITDTKQAINRGYKTVPMLEVELPSEQVLVYPFVGIMNIGGETHE